MRAASKACIVGGMSRPSAPSARSAASCSTKSGFPSATSRILLRVSSSTSPTREAASSSGERLEREHDGVRPRCRPGRAVGEQVWTRRAEEQDRRGSEVGDVLDEVEERRLGPVQVVEHDHQRPLSGQRLQVPARPHCVSSFVPAPTEPAEGGRAEHVVVEPRGCVSRGRAGSGGKGNPAREGCAGSSRRAPSPGSRSPRSAGSTSRGRPQRARFFLALSPNLRSLPASRAFAFSLCRHRTTTPPTTV